MDEFQALFHRCLGNFDKDTLDICLRVETMWVRTRSRPRQETDAKPHLVAAPSMVNLRVSGPTTFRDTLEGRLGLPNWLWAVKASTPVFDDGHVGRLGECTLRSRHIGKCCRIEASIFIRYAHISAELDPTSTCMLSLVQHTGTLCIRRFGPPQPGLRWRACKLPLARSR